MNDRTGLSHVRPDGSLHMVDVGAKPATERRATARCLIRMAETTGNALRTAASHKGDAFVAAQLAGIMAAKQTAALIPLAHPIGLSSVDVTFTWQDATSLQVEASAKTVGSTGVEMEAMVAASVAALTIYDMLKAIDRGITIDALRLVEKSGGRSGTWSAP